MRKFQDVLYVILIFMSIALGMNESNSQYFVLVLACITRLWIWVPVNAMPIRSGGLHVVYANLNKQYFSILGVNLFEVFRSLKRRDDVDKEVWLAKSNALAFVSYFKPLEIFCFTLMVLIFSSQSVASWDKPLLNIKSSVLAVIAMQIITIFINSLYCKIILSRMKE